MAGHKSHLTINKLQKHIQMKTKTIMLLIFTATLFSCKQKKYEMYNMMPMTVDVSEYINSGDFEPDSCKRRLNRLKRTSPKEMGVADEIMLQIKFKKWKNNYNQWLRKNKRDTVVINVDLLHTITSYQYSYVITNKPVDVYRTNTSIKINGIENLQLYIQVDDKGDFVSDYTENNYLDTSCDTINSRYQDIYTEQKIESEINL